MLPPCHLWIKFWVLESGPHHKEGSDELYALSHLRVAAGVREPNPSFQEREVGFYRSSELQPCLPLSLPHPSSSLFCLPLLDTQ